MIDDDATANRNNKDRAKQKPKEDLLELYHYSVAANADGFENQLFELGPDC